MKGLHLVVVDTASQSGLAHGINHTIFTKNREYAEAWLVVKRAELHGDFANNGVRPHEGE